MNYIRKKLEPKKVAQLYMNIINRTFQPEFFIQEDISLKDTVVLYIDIMSKGMIEVSTQEMGDKIVAELEK